MIKELNILLADDDADDRFFFDEALKISAIPYSLTSFENGAKLMQHLSFNSQPQADVLFLDINMPLKNGSECLEEIKSNGLFCTLPVIMYSTSLHHDVANLLYNSGAHYYIRKSGLKELQKNLHTILTKMTEKKFDRPTREHFILSSDLLSYN